VSGFAAGFFVSAAQINLWAQLIFLTAVGYFVLPYIVLLVAALPYLKFKHYESKYTAFAAGVGVWMCFAAVVWFLIVHGILTR
jgi:hypothetical protein